MFKARAYTQALSKIIEMMLLIWRKWIKNIEDKYMFIKVYPSIACMGSLVVNLRDKMLHVYHIMVYSVFKMHSETFIHSECIVEGKATQSEIFHITIK